MYRAPTEKRRTEPAGSRRYEMCARSELRDYKKAWNDAFAGLGDGFGFCVVDVFAGVGDWLGG